MSFVTEPEVVLVGKPVLEIDGIMRFLEEHGYEWPALEEKLRSMVSLGDDDGEWLVEMAGRMCYQSWPKQGKTPKGRSHEDHVKNLIKVGHGACIEHANFSFVIWNVSRSLCYHPDTVILTRHGWKQITDLNKDDQLLTFNSKTYTSRWSKTKSLKRFNYNGRLLGFKNSAFESPLMTEDHLLWAARYDKRRCRGLRTRHIMDNFAEKIPFNEIFGKKFVIDKEIPPTIGDFFGPTITVGKFTYNANDFWFWLGLLATDGTIVSSNRNLCEIQQSKKQNLEAIEQVCSKLFGNRRTHHVCKNGAHHYGISDVDLKKWCILHIGPNKANRHFSEFIINCNRELLWHFYQGALMGDGNVHRSNQHEVLYCHNQHTAEQWQIILAKLGMCGNVRLDDRRGKTRQMANGNWITNNLISYVVSVSKQTASLIKKKHQFEQQYIGPVFCPETEDGIVFVRRGNGHPMWSGNTHELVRHRIASYSQLSQRYVDSSNVSFIVPPAIQELAKTDPTTYQTWVEHCEQSRQLYEELTTKLSEMYGDIESNLERRKKARQAARSVLPNAAETKIFVTMNARAIRHLIELRANPAADLEIRKLAVKICRILQDKALLFAHGLGIIKLEDGTEGVNSVYRRV